MGAGHLPPPTRPHSWFLALALLRGLRCPPERSQGPSGSADPGTGTKVERRVFVTLAGTSAGPAAGPLGWPAPSSKCSGDLPRLLHRYGRDPRPDGLLGWETELAVMVSEAGLTALAPESPPSPRHLSERSGGSERPEGHVDSRRAVLLGC